MTKDVLPVLEDGREPVARIYGINSVGLLRRGFTRKTVAALKEAYRMLLQSRLNTTEALARLEAEGPHVTRGPDARGVRPQLSARRDPEAPAPPRDAEEHDGTVAGAGRRWA